MQNKWSLKLSVLAAKPDFAGKVEEVCRVLGRATILKAQVLWQRWAGLMIVGLTILF